MDVGLIELFSTYKLNKHKPLVITDVFWDLESFKSTVSNIIDRYYKGIEFFEVRCYFYSQGLKVKTMRMPDFKMGESDNLRILLESIARSVIHESKVYSETKSYLIAKDIRDYTELDSVLVRIINKQEGKRTDEILGLPPLDF